jgi:hypothetical protein
MEFRDQQTQNGRVATLMELMNDERIISKKEREILSLRFGLDNQPELTLSAAAARTLAVWRPCRRLIGGVFFNRGRKMSRPFGRSAESVL